MMSSKKALYMRKYRREHSEKMKEIRRRYYLKHREEVLANAREYRESHREEVRARNRDYDRNRRNQDKKSKRSKNYYQHNKAKILKRQRKYAEKNRVKLNAKALAENHVPLANECSVCGSTENLERHHPDYSKPKKVITVCKSCHNLIHSEHCPKEIRTAVRDLLSAEAWGRKTE